MALETLNGIDKIGGFGLTHSHGSLSKGMLYCETPMLVDHTQNTISFKLQNGPIKEVGVNGVQVDAMIEAAKLIIEGLNKSFPCRENSCAITKLDEALMWLEKRTKDREKRGVEGTSYE